jgi:hypothetical protein
MMKENSAKDQRAFIRDKVESCGSFKWQVHRGCRACSVRHLRSLPATASSHRIFPFLRRFIRRLCIPLTMATSFSSSPDLPTIPTIREVETWDEGKVLRWIQHRDPILLKGDNLDNFNRAGIAGRAFLATDVNFLNSICGLSPGANLGLVHLVNEVKESKFIPCM